MLHTKFQAIDLVALEKKDLFKVFTIYGHCSHLGDVTWTNYANFSFPIL